MKKGSLLILFFALIFSHCSDHTQSAPCNSYPSITIVSSITGGWVGASDSMNIHQQAINYRSYCQSQNKNKTFTISCDEWNLLLSKINIADFNDLDIHTCNACVDGVDYSISIKTDTSYHKITFGNGESIPVIKDLHVEIEKLRTKFVGNICPN